MSNEVRVLRMNQLSSTRYEDVSLPARQQLGDFDELVDVDARSGNGLRDYDGLRVSTDARDFDEVNPERNGDRVLGVTYHLDSTPPPAEPEGAPGSEGYKKHRAGSRVRIEDQAEGQDGLVYREQGNARLAMQSDQEYLSTQREIPGRNERYANAVGQTEHASAAAGSGHAAVVLPSASIADSDGEVPTGTIASVKSYVGESPERAQKALEAEQRRDNPRNTLVEWLQERIEGDKE